MANIALVLSAAPRSPARPFQPGRAQGPFPTNPRTRDHLCPRDEHLVPR